MKNGDRVKYIGTTWSDMQGTPGVIVDDRIRAQTITVRFDKHASNHYVLPESLELLASETFDVHALALSVLDPHHDFPESWGKKLRIGAAPVAIQNQYYLVTRTINATQKALDK